MKTEGMLKRLPGAVILMAEIVMSRQISKPLSLEILPVWHRWSWRLSAGLFAAFLIISLVLYLICEVRGKKAVLFAIWGLVCLFMANTLYASPWWLQTVLAFALALRMINAGFFRNAGSSAAVLAVFIACALFATVLVPPISKVEKPKLYTDLEDFWMDLFETRTDPNGSGSQPPEPETESTGGVPDNMITNDPFPDDDETPICGIKSTYPLGMLRIFSCGDYDPRSFTFSIYDDLSAFPGSHSPSGDYYKHAIKGSAELPEKAVVTDYRPKKAMMLAPACTFGTGSEGVTGFGDRFIYRNEALSSVPVQYDFDPGEYYSYTSLAYEKQVQAEYLRLPDEFKPELLHYVSLLGIDADAADPGRSIALIMDALSEGFTFSFDPPDLPEGEDPVMWFLLQSRTGYSKHFAAAEVFLFRAAGIPARYSFGYSVREYEDGEAEVFRRDAFAFCEVFVDGAWRLPEDVLSMEGGASGRIGQKTQTESRNSEDPVLLPNLYDISHLKGTASMFGPYDEGRSYWISRFAKSGDSTVVLIVDTGVDVDYIKAYSTGDYIYPNGYFSIGYDTVTGSEFEEGKDFGEYARDAFMCPGFGEDLPEVSGGFRVFNLYAPKHIYAPVFPVSTDGLAGGSPESFGMAADRMIIPLSGDAAYGDYTLFAGSEPAGANDAYTDYALEKYTQVPEEMLYYLRQFLAENGIDPDSPDKGALADAVRSLLSVYTYTANIEPIPEDEDPVMWFLTVSRAGYCQHFASAGTMLLRACGIPARYTAGYIKEIQAGSVAEVTARDSHAWTEVYDGRTWKLVEMCTGVPAEGQVLPIGIRTEKSSYELPRSGSQNGPEGPGEEVPEDKAPFLTRGKLTAAALFALAAAIASIAWKHRPDGFRKAAIRYRYISRYYYISEDTQRLLNKINYSREGASPEDLEAIGRCFSNARSLLIFRRKYLRYAASMAVYAFWYLCEIGKNLARRRG